MERIWVDQRDDQEWEVEAVYVMPKREPGQPVAIMGPDVPLRIWFRSGRREYFTVKRLDDDLESLSDDDLERLLDEARGHAP